MKPVILLGLADDSINAWPESPHCEGQHVMPSWSSCKKKMRLASHMHVQYHGRHCGSGGQGSRPSLSSRRSR